METRVAVVGDGALIGPFKGVGIRVVEVGTHPPAERVRQLIEEGYGIIFFSEELLPELGGLLFEIKGSPLPCLIPIPFEVDQAASVGRLKELVRRSVGADIFLKSEP